MTSSSSHHEPAAGRDPHGAAHGAPRVVALGGGHGLSATLSALRLLTPHITAVVTVADDGGSSGRIRQQFDVLPPGDLRMALAALCDDSEWGLLWREAVQHRFDALAHAPRELDGHSMGNLLLLSLWQILQDPVEGLRWASRLLNAQGEVLPMALDPLVISGHAIHEDGRREHLVGQARLAQCPRVEDLRLEPQDARPCPEALSAIRAADWVVLGPGSWYTSVLPHLLMPAVRDAVVAGPGRVCLSMNLGLEGKETTGLGAEGHLEVLEAFAPGLRLDAVVADPTAVPDPESFDRAVAARGARTVWGSLRTAPGENVHNHLRLAAAYQEVFADRTRKHS